MTLRQYLDELKLRLMRYEVNTTFDDLYIASVVNNARQNVVLSVLDIYPNLFVTDVNFALGANAPRDNLYFQVVNYQGVTLDAIRVQMPPNFIKPIECWFVYQDQNGVTEWKQIRIVDKKEFYFAIRHAYNTTHPTTLLGHFEQLISDGRVYFTFAVPMAITTSGQFGNFVLRVFYHFLPDQLELFDDVAVGAQVVPNNTNSDLENVIPTFLEDLVIKESLVELLSNIDQVNALQRAKDELNISKQLIKFNKDIEYLRRKSLLPSKKTIDNSNIPLIAINLGGQNG